MKHWKVSLGLATLLTLASPMALATNYYLSDCQAGFASGCIRGNNSANGTSMATPKQTVAGLPTLVAGDTVSLAKGGAFSMPVGGWMLTMGSRNSVITYTSYQAAWCSAGACLTQKPLLIAVANDTAIAFYNWGGPVHGEGAVVSHLELINNSTSQYQAAIVIYNDKDYITLDDLDMHGFGIGISAQGVNGTPDLNVSDGFNDHITIKNSNIHNNLNQGILMLGNDLLIENNNFDLNGNDPAGCGNRCHNLYLGGAVPSTIYGHSSRIVVRGNTFGRSGTGPTSICSGTSLNIHGNVDDVTIENNTLDVTAGADGGCYGIDVVAADTAAETLQNIVVRGNKVINHGGTGIGMGSCINCTIENNVIVFQAAGYEYAGIKVPDNTPGAGDATQQAITVRNNSIYMARADANSVAIRLDTYGTLHKVVSNLIYFGGASTTGHKCFQAGPISMFTAFDNNLCYDSSSFYKWSASYPTLASAQAAGFDVRGLNADPLLIAVPSLQNNFSMALHQNSPAASAGNQALSAPTDISGQLRGSSPDIGAWQQGSLVVPPAAPTGLMAQ